MTPRASRGPTGHGGLPGWVALRLGVFLALLAPAYGQVRLELRIPRAETWVLGDAIPLHWRFLNQSTQALGFMWEGCCRLNGKLAVRAGDQTLPTAPPGQALAHMFAKADRLEPGQPKEYETRVGDWVRLPGTGNYELRGTYRGVLPTQFPQLQRGLALWRDAAESPSLAVSVLGLDDYLAQRPAREARRGLRARLIGPASLPVTRPARFRVALENRASAPCTVTWPDDVGLWVVRPDQERVAPSLVIGGVTESLALPAGGGIEREFVLPPGALEGENPGAYRFFVDVAASPSGDPRVPSETLPVTWQLGEPEVRELLVAAARGAGSGARNAPLKLLRVHLADVAPVLAALENAGTGLDPATRGLLLRLGQAATLRPLLPRPGSVAIVLEVGEDGTPAWRQPEVRAALGKAPGSLSPSDGMRELLACRRHLGWELSLVLQPRDTTTVGRLLATARTFAPLADELSGRIRVLGADESARIELGDGEPVAGHPTLRLGNAGRAEWAADGRGFAPASGPSGWQPPSGEWRLEVDPETRWSEIAPWLGRGSGGDARRIELRAR